MAEQIYSSRYLPLHAEGMLKPGVADAGHLRCLSATDLYRYLSQEHEATTVGLLVGMGAARAGTMDSTVAKMLFLHIPARHPAGYPDLDVAPTVQAAALLGAGLLYRGTCHRYLRDSARRNAYPVLPHAKSA